MNDDVQHLTQIVDQKDRRFRLAQSIFMCLVTVALIILLLAIYNLQTQNRDLVKQQASLLAQQKKSVDELKHNTNSQLQQLNNHLDCIAKFFATANRADFSITDLNNCAITKTSSAQTFSSDTPSFLASPPVAEQTPQSSTSNTTTPVANTSPPNATPSPSPPSSPPAPSPTPSPSPSPLPFMLCTITSLPLLC